MCPGASEMLMANAVSQLAAKTPGKEAAAMEAFAAALRQVTTLSECLKFWDVMHFLNLSY